MTATKFGEKYYPNFPILVATFSRPELAGEMGPIANYANDQAITGRAGIYPSRYQSDKVDRATVRWCAAPTASCAP